MKTPALFLQLFIPLLFFGCVRNSSVETSFKEGSQENQFYSKYRRSPSLLTDRIYLDGFSEGVYIVDEKLLPNGFVALAIVNADGWYDVLFNEDGYAAGAGKAGVNDMSGFGLGYQEIIKSTSEKAFQVVKAGQIGVVKFRSNSTFDLRTDRIREIYGIKNFSASKISSQLLLVNNNRNVVVKLPSSVIETFINVSESPMYKLCLDNLKSDSVMCEFLKNLE